MISLDLVTQLDAAHVNDHLTGYVWCDSCGDVHCLAWLESGQEICDANDDNYWPLEVSYVALALKCLDDRNSH